MAGSDDIMKKAQRFLADGRVQDALKSEKSEGASDAVLDAVSRAADKATGGAHSDKIRQARDAADRKLGDR
ncbi:Rv0909 family putative TA system antitoxin [Frigoribacterium salinisoli]